MSELAPHVPLPARAARPRPGWERALDDAAAVVIPALLAFGWTLLGAGALFLPPLAGVPLAVATAALFLWMQFWRGSGRAAVRRRARLRLRPVPVAALGWLAALSASEAALQLSLDALLSALGLAAAPREPGLLTETLAKPGGWMTIVALTVLLAPLVEEFFYRGWMQGHLERRAGAAWGIVVTAAVFAIAHLQWGGLANLFAGGVVLGFAVHATRSVWTGVLLHAAWNGLALLLWVLFPDADPTGAAWPVPAALLLAALAATVWAGRGLWARTRGRHRGRGVFGSAG